MSNFRNVLKVFTMMRDFEPDDHALLNTLRGVTEAEREMLVEALGPVKKATRRRNGTGRGGRSPRATSLAGAIAGTAKGFCVYKVTPGATCNETESNPIHDKNAGYAGYHPFQPAIPTEASEFRTATATNAGGRD